jgi:hypothetical protein
MGGERGEVMDGWREGGGDGWVERGGGDGWVERGGGDGWVERGGREERREVMDGRRVGR